MTPQLQAAVARTVITPPVGITHGNWGAQTHTRAEGVDLDLWATALVLANAETKVAIVDIDLIGYPAVATTREVITRLTGIPRDHVRLSVTHTHSAGNLGPAWFPDGAEMTAAYAASLPDRIAGIVWEAQRNLRPARVAGGKGQSNVGVNRRLWYSEQGRIVLGRNWSGFTDHEMIIARIDDENERPIATIVNYACHPTIMAHRNALVTPDYPGALRRTVEEIVGGKCLFLQGAAGNVHPKESFSNRAEDYHRVGQLLGLEASKVALELETRPKVERLFEVLESGAELGIYVDEPSAEPDDTLRVVTASVSLPLIELPSVEEADADYRKKTADLVEARRRGDEREISLKSMLAKRAGMRLGQSQAYHSKKTATIEMQAIRIGSLALIGMPGEPFAEIGVEVRRRSPFAVTMFSGYSNGGFAYIPTKEDYQFGGYGVWNSPVAAGAAERVVEKAVTLLHKLM